MALRTSRRSDSALLCDGEAGCARLTGVLLSKITSALRVTSAAGPLLANQPVEGKGLRLHAAVIPLWISSQPCTPLPLGSLGLLRHSFDRVRVGHRSVRQWAMFPEPPPGPCDPPDERADTNSWLRPCSLHCHRRPAGRPRGRFHPVISRDGCGRRATASRADLLVGTAICGVLLVGDRPGNRSC
jgi:hypothetical protein